VFLLDRRGRITRANRAARHLLGREEAELLGRPFADLVLRSSVPTTPRAILERAPRGTVEGLEGQLRNAAGRGVDVSLGFTVLRDSTGRIAGVVAAARDVRPLRRRLDELRAALTWQAQFVRSMRREFCAPLAAAIDRLHAAATGGDAQVARVLDALQRLDRALDETDEVLRLQTGRLRLRVAPADLVEVARAAQAMVAGRALPPHRYELVAPRGGLVGRWDGPRLTGALAALLDNAARYSPPHSLVRLTIQHQGEQALLRVRDKGRGIPPDEQPHLGEPFFRGRLSEGSGLGLGLYLARAIVRLHGGRLGLEYSGADGSVFRVQLPLRGRAGAPRRTALRARA
jgi:PAS domain S-box-containing protein